MARENFLNLLEDFEKHKNYELIIFTTYSFDAFFFDNVLLRVLKQNNPRSEIIILVDAEHYPKPQESTDATGVEYALIPIPNSVFHPKLFLFYNKKGSLVYVGSHNLTLSGFIHNFELCCKLRNEEAITDSLEYVLLTLRKVFDKENYFVKRIEEVLKERPKQSENGTHLIHNFDSPILHKTLDIIKEKKIMIDKVTVIAPFFSAEKQLLSLIHSAVGVNEIVVCIQKYNHNLDVDSITGLPFVSIKEVVPKDNRRIHSKLILFEGPKENYLLMGSPNFTINALEKTAGIGNFEVSTLLMLQDKALFKELEIKKIRNDEVIKTKRIEDTRLESETKAYEVFLTASHLDIFNRLMLNFKANIDEKEFTLNIHHPRAERIEVPVLVGKSRSSVVVPIDGKILSGSSIWLSDSTGNLVSNVIRVYNPSEQGLASRYYGANLKQIPELIAHSKQLEEMLQIIAALFMEERIEHEVGKQKYSVSGPSPGRIISTGASEDILEMIKDLLRIPRAKPIETRTERTPPSDKAAMVEPSEIVRPVNLDIEIAKILEKFKKAFEIRKLSFDNSPLMYSIYILIILKLLGFVSPSRRNEILRRQIANLSELLDEYGISKEKQEGELLTFLSILIHIQNQISGYWHSIIRRLVGQIEPILFSEDDPLKGLQFADKIPEFLGKVKLQPAGDINEYRKAIAFIVSQMIKEKSSRVQTNCVRKLTDQMLILSGPPPSTDHLKALFAFWVLEKILQYNSHLKLIAMSIIGKSENFRGFTKTLVDDMLKI